MVSHVSISTSIRLHLEYLYRRHFKQFQNDHLGCNSVSWAPFNAIGSQTEDGSVARRLVTGSCDNVVRFWRSLDADGQWSEEPKQPGAPVHSG